MTPKVEINRWDFLAPAAAAAAAVAGNFLNAANCSEAIALAGAAIHYNNKIFNENRCAPAMLWDREAMAFTNAPDANRYLKREYRDGWKLTGA
jgi:hypothetical protein